MLTNAAGAVAMTKATDNAMGKSTNACSSVNNGSDANPMKLVSSMKTTTATTAQTPNTLYGRISVTGVFGCML